MPLMKDGKLNMTEEFGKFLEENGFLPLSNWQSFEILHLPLSPEDRKQTFSKIKMSFRGKKGLYVYEKNGEILYVGQGILFDRIENHYKESCGINRATKPRSKAWYEFFSSHQGRVKIYWRELKGEQIRIIIEQILHYILKPTFDCFRKRLELKDKGKKTLS